MKAAAHTPYSSGSLMESHTADTEVGEVKGERSERSKGSQRLGQVMGCSLVRSLSAGAGLKIKYAESTPKFLITEFLIRFLVRPPSVMSQAHAPLTAGQGWCQRCSV